MTRRPISPMANDSTASADALRLISLAVSANSRVLVIRAAESAAIDTALGERGCEVEAAASVDEALEVNADAAFDAVVLVDGFEDIDDPAARLTALAKLLRSEGKLLVAASNGASARARVATLLGDDLGAPTRRYDKAALQQVIDATALPVLDRLRVFDSPIGAADAALPDEVLDRVNALDEATTATFVIVLGAPDAVASGTATLAEALQSQIESLTRSVASSESRIHELTALQADAEAALAAAQETLAANELELANRAAALLERIDVIDRLHTEKRHLELDVAVKNDYIADLRTELQTWQDDFWRLRAEWDDLKRSRHYRVAAGMHRVLRQIPFAHTIARLAAKALAKVVRPEPTPPA